MQLLVPSRSSEKVQGLDLGWFPDTGLGFLLGADLPLAADVWSALSPRGIHKIAYDFCRADHFPWLTSRCYFKGLQKTQDEVMGANQPRDEYASKLLAP